MTENRRIALNTIATYGRSVFSVVCGVFSARWVLMSLGQVDFGLYGLIGSLVVFISFLNIQFAGAIARYYAFSVGRARAMKDTAIVMEESRCWFTTALLIHTVVPIGLIFIGYPVGVFAVVNGFLNIPADRVDACVWIWRFVCASTFVGMVNVPFQAMYTAKQYIAELTIYSFIQTIVRTGFMYFMVTHPREWLVPYGCAMLIIQALPQAIICCRAIKIFPECRVRLYAIRHGWRILQLSKFAFWQGVGGVGFIASHQCMSIIINKWFGPRITGSFSVAQTVAGEAAALTGALQGAFAPAITTVYGAGEQDKSFQMAFQVCKIGTVLTLLFSLPMGLEIDEVLRIWLKEPPPLSSGMCLSMLLFISLEKLTIGHVVAINASGNVAKFQAVRGIARSLVIPLALIMILLSRDATFAVLALPISVVIVDVADVLVASEKIGMSVGYWLKNVVIPILIIALISALIGLAPRMFLEASVLRVVFTTLIVVACVVVSSWFFLLSGWERTSLSSKAKMFLKRASFFRRNCNVEGGKYAIS